VPGYLGLVVLTRILEPDDFGVVGIAGLWLGMLNAFVGAGFGPAIVQRREIDRADLSSLATITVLLGALVTVVAALVAAPLCQLLGVPEATPYARVSSIAFVLAGFGIVPGALLQRRLAFDRLAARDVAAAVVSVGAGVGAALAGAGAWALVLQPLVLAAVSSALVWWSERSRVGLALPRWSVVQSHATYSRDVTLFQVVKAVLQTSYRGVIGSVAGTYALGLYMLAYKLTVETTAVARAGLGGFLFPYLAQRQDDPDQLRPAYVRATRDLLGLLSVGLAAVVVLAPPAVPVVFGDGWERAAHVVPLLAVVALADCVFGTSGELMKATGHTRGLLLWSLAYAVTQVVGLVTGALVGGFEGAAAGAALASLALLPMSFAQAGRQLRLDPLRLATSVLPPVTAPVVAAGSGLLAWALLPHPGALAIDAVLVLTLAALGVMELRRLRTDLPSRGATPAT
jgi:O-antigen/teichoic acid export membrane protein